MEDLEPRTQLLAAVPLAPLKRNKGLSLSSRNYNLPEQMIPTNGALQKAQNHTTQIGCCRLSPITPTVGKAERQDGPV